MAVAESDRHPRRNHPTRTDRALRYGDPGSLPLDAKKTLLLNYAKAGPEGRRADYIPDERALWMFSDPELASTIERCWGLNKREFFRTNLLRIVREGRIAACAHLARKVAVDQGCGDHFRIVALEALSACEDTDGLRQAAGWLKGAAGPASAVLAPEFVGVLFPEHLDVDEVLRLVELTPSAEPGSLGGFESEVAKLWEVCPDSDARERLIVGLSDLSLSPPFQSRHGRISARHVGIARRMAKIARDVVIDMGNADPPGVLVRFLMAVERADSQRNWDQEEPALRALVTGDSQLQRTLFWADVEETRLNDNRHAEEYPTRLSHVWGCGDVLWELGPHDVGWLFEDYSHRPLVADRQVALSALARILRAAGELDSESSRLGELAAGCNELAADLDGYLAPPSETELEAALEHERNTQQKQDREAEERKETEAQWIRFREELQADPAGLTDPARLADWETGSSRLYWLTQWLQKKTGKNAEQAALQWQLLAPAPAFGGTVAEAYCEGMKVLWRITRPEAPERTDRGFSRKHPSVLSFAGIGVEAREESNWPAGLSAADAACAARHACMSELGYPEWLDKLIDQRGVSVLPVVSKALEDEWKSHDGGQVELLTHYRDKGAPFPPSVQGPLFEIMMSEDATSLRALDRGIQALRRMQFSDEERRRVVAVARRRFRAALKVDDVDRAVRSIALLFLADTDQATTQLIKWIDTKAATTEAGLAVLFGREFGLAAEAPTSMSVPALSSLVRIAYREVNTKDDAVHEGAYSPDERDEAEWARERLFSSLVDRRGPDAYQAVLSLSEEKGFPLSSSCLIALAREKAEQDAEPPRW